MRKHPYSLARGVRPRTSETWIAATGGEAASVALCHELGLDYVSCSPYRVSLARLEAAQAALKECRRTLPPGG